MKNKKTGMLVNLALISQVGIMMIVPIFAGVYIGQKLDEKLGTTFLWLICLLLGIGAAFRNLFQLASKKAKEYENESSPSREVDQFMKKVKEDQEKKEREKHTLDHQDKKKEK